MVVKAELCPHCDTEAITLREEDDCTVLGRLKTEGQYGWYQIICHYAVTPSVVKPHPISLTCPLSDYLTSKLCPDWFMVAAGI